MFVALIIVLIKLTDILHRFIFFPPLRFTYLSFTMSQHEMFGPRFVLGEG